MVRRVAVTTLDNPYDPFDQYAQWSAFDERKGYGTQSFLARLTGNLHELGDSLYQEAIEQAVDEMVEVNLLGLWVKVVRESDSELTSRGSQ